MKKKNELIAVILSLLLAFLFINAAESSLCSDSEKKEKPRQNRAPVQEQIEEEIEEEEIPLEILANEFTAEDSFDVEMNEVYDNTEF